MSGPIFINFSVIDNESIHSTKHKLVVTMVCLILLTACGNPTEEEVVPTTILETPTKEIHTITPSTTLTLTPDPTVTVTPLPTQTPTPGVGSTMVSPQDGAVLVYVPEGEFSMGGKYEQVEKICIGLNSCKVVYDLDEQPIHSIYLDAYWIYQTEVTNEMFVRFMNSQTEMIEGSRDWGSISYMFSRGNATHVHLVGDEFTIDWGFNEHPVEGVTWYEAQGYCEWAGGRLPTEAEWEKAARGDDERIFPWGDEINCNLANSKYCVGGTMPVGSFPEGASPFGAMDMAGNVREWVGDWYNKDYYSWFFSGESPKDPTGPPSGDKKVIRGGGYDSGIAQLRGSYRQELHPSYDWAALGFRCVME